MRWRIRYQLLAPLLMLLVGVAGISTWTAIASAHRAWQQVEARFRGVAQTLSEATFPLQEPILRQMKGLSGADFLLVSPTGKRTATFPDPAAALVPSESTVADDWQSLRLFGPVSIKGEPYLCGGLRLHRHPENAGDTLYILYPESLWRDALWEAVRPPLLLGGFVALVSVALAVFLGQGLSRRVQELERRTRLIAAGDFSPMPLPKTNDELRDLARSVNEMAQQLSQLRETVQKTERLRLLGQVSGGLAHQLRNGITGAKLAVQLYLREGPSADAESLQVALRQLTLVETHLKRFLDLGRSGPFRREACSMTAVVNEVAGLLRPQCRHARIDFRWQPPAADVVVTGDAGQLGQMLLNVVSNAVEAAGSGGSVEVLLSSSRARAVLEVLDSGPGPSPEVAARLFEPFATGKPEGVGLGLAFAKQIAEAHGGNITWRRDAARTVFRIELST